MNPRLVEQFFSLRNEYRSLRYDLRNMEVLCRALGDPQKDFRSVLIAGTNGKGSVARFLASMLPSAGLYVSPHLERLNERISVAGREIDDDSLGAAFEAVRRACRDARAELLYPPTYFERLTAMAFWYFRERTTYAVLEVGLGGRLDATNVVDQDVSVVTNVGLDHQQYLGESLEQIAGEKAGIIGAAEPVVTGPACDYDVIRDRAGRRLVKAGSFKAEAEALGDGFYKVDIQTTVRS